MLSMILYLNRFYNYYQVNKDKEINNLKLEILELKAKIENL